MENRVYIGTYTRGGSEGIYCAAFENGELSILRTQPARNPSYLAVCGDCLYAVEETPDGSAVSYKVDGLALAESGKQRVLGDDPCHVFVSSQWLYVSNYTSGSIAALPLDHGNISGPPHLIAHEGGSAHPTRQRAAHVHQATLSPNGQYLAVCDLGMDKVLFYPHDARGIHTPAEPVCVPKGEGPRHAVFGRNFIWYVVCELSCNVLVYRGYGESAELIQQCATLREGEEGACAALRLSPDGRWLMASVRRANTLVLFRVLPDGSLAEGGHFDAHGDWPRDAAFSRDQQYVLCALEKSDAVAIFRLSDGALSFAGSVSIPSPTCICFA